MSHFSVLVIGKDPEEKLAPYQENNMGDCPREYMKFNDVTDEIRDDFENGTTSEWWPDNGNSSVGDVITEDQYNELKINGEIILDGYVPEPFSILHFKPGNRLKVCFEYPKEVWEEKEHRRWSEHIYAVCKEVLPDIEDRHRLSRCLLELIEPPREVALKEKYKTFEAVAEEYHGYKYDAEQGAYGYWENPNRKWDWYELGGRWRGVFKVKHENAASTLGNPGVFNNDPEYDSDQTLKGNIDWEFMNNDAEKRRRLEKSWDEIAEGKSFYKPEYYTKKYGSKEGYVRQELEFSTWAVVTEDGKWHEPGEMGWWGISSSSPEEESEFKRGYFNRFIKNLPDDTLLSVFDCHI